MIGNTMTAARQQRKSCRPGLGRRAWLRPDLARRLVRPPIGAATTERVVVDRHTGLAISGFDPVAYFTDGGAADRAGPSSNSAYAGAVWRFRNEGNRAAFAADPEIYMPRFGGYDPVGVARAVRRARRSASCG